MNILEQIMIFGCIAVAGYLIGSIPCGFIIGKLKGIDIRTVGSGNIGATNVTRAVSPLAGKICFALDFCKGLLPVLALKMLVGKGIVPVPAWGLGELAMIFAVVLGHMFTCFLGFIPQRKVILERKRRELEAEEKRIRDSIAYIDWKQGFYDDILSGKQEYFSNLTAD